MFLKKFQKFQNSLKADIESDSKLFLDLLEQVGGIKADMSKLKKYMELGTAISKYAPEEKFTGNTVLVQATVLSGATLPIPNEDYNVSKVSYYNFPKPSNFLWKKSTSVMTF